ncbi:MAG: hypothetical protein Q4F97_12740 [Bacteroidales bacterium]|nr:hypothetical protein [Bacteroidales bacterium]
MKKLIIPIIFFALFLSSIFASRFYGVLFTVPDEVFYKGERYFINYTPLYPFENYPSLFSDIPKADEMLVSNHGKRLFNTSQNYTLGWTIQDSVLYLIGVGFFSEIDNETDNNKFKELENLTNSKFTYSNIDISDRKNIPSYINIQEGKSIKASWVNGKFYLKMAMKDSEDFKDWMNSGPIIEMKFENGVLISQKEVL